MTTKRNRVIAILLSLTIVFSVAGAGIHAAAYVLNSGDYIKPSLIKQFEKETGYKVKYTTMTSNEEMMIKLRSEDCIYDLC